MDKINPSQIVVADAASGAAAASTTNDPQENSPPPYLKLVGDCWEHILDLLSLKDIHSIGLTCNRLYQLAGYYFRENCPELYFVLMQKEIPSDVDSGHLRVDFYKFLREMLIQDQLDYFLDAKTFAALQTLAFNALKITESQIEYCKNVLQNVENLLLFDCTTDADDVFSQFANYCPKLKYLVLQRCHEPDAIFNKVFLHHYPTLERMKYGLYPWDEARQIDELQIFLEKHTKLEHFECDDRFLWANRAVLNRTNVQLNRLSIYLKTSNIAMQFDQFVDVLRQLFGRGFYKSLHFSLESPYGYSHNYQYLLNTISILSALDQLSIDVMSSFNYLSSLANLIELRIFKHDQSATEMETMAKSLIKLQRLTIDIATIDNILPFIRHSKKLKTIKILHLRGNHVLDLYKLNEERKQLENADKVVIYARENAYLYEKWQTKNLHLSHVSIERFVAFADFLR